MFVEAIEKAGGFTRPLHTISRNYGSTTIQPGTSTIFFVNPDGWALTCRHIGDMLRVSEAINRKANEFRQEIEAHKDSGNRSRMPPGLEKKYGYSGKVTFEIYNSFLNCVDTMTGFDIFSHPEYDIALIKFKGFNRILCETFPVFPADASSLKQGKMLCRLGFPFPEFTNFEYNRETDRIIWTSGGRPGTPRFPLEGMVTRFVLDGKGYQFAFELSTPGLRGQSGGPAFDTEAKVWGMQFATHHLDLNFDVDQEVLRQGVPTRIRDSAFLHVGRCIHVEVLKDFMRKNNVSFTEE